jgi:hypothetical protein
MVAFCVLKNCYSSKPVIAHRSPAYERPHGWHVVGQEYSIRKPRYTAESVDIELLSITFVKIQSLPALHLTA